MTAGVGIVAVVVVPVCMVGLVMMGTVCIVVGVVITEGGVRGGGEIMGMLGLVLVLVLVVVVDVVAAAAALVVPAAVVEATTMDEDIVWAAEVGRIGMTGDVLAALVVPVVATIGVLGDDGCTLVVGATTAEEEVAEGTLTAGLDVVMIELCTLIVECGETAEVATAEVVATPGLEVGGTIVPLGPAPPGGVVLVGQMVTVTVSVMVSIDGAADVHGGQACIV